MKTGKHYFGLLTRDEQRNFKKACEEQGVNFDYALTRGYNNLWGFIRANLCWSSTKKGYEYWQNIANSNRTKPLKKDALVTFKQIFIYSMATFLAVIILMIAYKAGYDKGRLKGYQHGIEKVYSIVNYEELTPESVEAVQEMQLNTVRINKNR